MILYIIHLVFRPRCLLRCNATVDMPLLELFYKRLQSLVYAEDRCIELK
jgi:hypothetical protein